MVKPFATLPVLFTLQLITSGFTTHVDGASDVDTPLTDEDKVVPDGYTPFPDIGMGYNYFEMELSWEEARKHCNAEGGNLAVTDSSEKVEYAKSLAPQRGTKYLFVGIHKYFSDSEWVSLRTGLPLAHIPWQTNPTTGSARCAGIATGENGLFVFACETPGPHICEVPMRSIPLQISNKTIVGNVRVSSIFENRSFLKQAIVVPEGYTAFPDIGVAYKYYDQNLTWNSARKHCATEGGSLAVIDSFEKKQYANNKVSAGGPDPFVGFHKLFDNSEWVSVKTGLPVDFVPWRGGSGLRDKTRSCAGLSTTGVTPFSCGAHGPHICEIPLSEASQKPNNLTDIQSSKRAAELPSGYTVYTHLGVAYKFHRTEIEWNNARKYCASHGANLAVIDSYEKVQHVIELRGASKENIFVGMHRLFDDVEWIDVKNGSPRVAIPWRHLTHENVPSRLCMKLSTYDGDHGLYAAECTAPRGFVCEVSIFRD